MNGFDLLGPPPASDHARRSGVTVGIVLDNKDPNGLGRVKVRLPSDSNEEIGLWARVAVLMAGKGRGTFFLPEKDDEVLVAFEYGDITRPYILGALWNGRDAPPETNDDGKNNLRVIKSRSGHQIRLDDTDGSEKIQITDKSGDNRITFDTASNTISVASAQDMELKAGQGQIKVQGATKVIVDASQIEIVENASHPLVFGDQLLQYLNQIVQLFATHTHPGELALGVLPVTPMPPVPPLPPATPALLSTKVKTG